MLTWTDISGYYLRLKEKKIKETEVNITLENGNTIHLKQTTDYPETDEIVLEVTDASAATVLNIRVPDWVKDPAVKINGEAVDAVTAGSYIAVTVNAGDRIEITYPSELTWVEGDNSNDGLWAMKKGPMVYAIAAAYVGGRVTGSIWLGYCDCQRDKRIETGGRQTGSDGRKSGIPG